MSYQGRSPLKDVVRSVVIGATMVGSGVLEGCSHPVPVNPPPTPSGSDGGATMVPGPVDASGIAVAPQDAAPPTNVVRPRPDNTNTNNMPTRGFAGGARRARG